MDKINQELLIRATDRDLFALAAQQFSEMAIAQVASKGRFNVVLAGGNTPKAYFSQLAATADIVEATPWDHIHFYFGDERYVPEDDDNNNYHMACEFLFSTLAVPKQNIHRIPTTEFASAKEAASKYAKQIADVDFDLIYLGLGDNAHTASLMPDTDLVKAYANGTAEDHLVAGLWVEALKMYRITLTPPAINRCPFIAFMAVGANKAEAVWQILKGPHDPVQYPAQLIHSDSGKTVWYLDQAAASKVDK